MSPGITHIHSMLKAVTLLLKFKEKDTGYNLKAGNIKEFVVMI